MYSTTLEDFEKWYVAETNESILLSERISVFGGVHLSNWFMNHSVLCPSNLYLVEFLAQLSDFASSQNESKYLSKPSQYFVLETFSLEPHRRILKYKKTLEPSPEHQYLDLCKRVMTTGNRRVDRTGTGTMSVFGTQMRFDLTRGLPLLTTKRVALKSCIEELLWFLRGDTDARILQEKGVHIWDGNSTREFLDLRGLTNYEDGVLGPIYGWQWRFFGAKYYPMYADTSKHTPTDGIDQIGMLIQGLKRDPFSRRHVISAWNPQDLPDMALPPCHYTFQFYVEQDSESDQKYLSCHFIMRSNDLGCGTSFNLLSYAVLTHIIALKVDMIPKELVYTCSDTHVYLNHLEPLRTQLERTPSALPRLFIHPEVKTKDWNQITLADFDIIGYYPESSIKLQMAV